jgi:hypothetical protein
MKLRFLKGRLRGRVVDVSEDGFVVGRDPDSDLAIDEDGISRRHCRFFVKDGEWHVEDLGSTNGVRVNGELITGSYPIKKGDRIGLFNQVLLFADDKSVVQVAESGAKVSAGETVAVKGAPVAAAEVSSPQPGVQDSAAAAPSEGSQSFPWFHVVVMALVALVLGWLVYMTFIHGGEKKAETPAASVVEAESSPAAAEAPAADDDILPVTVAVTPETLVEAEMIAVPEAPVAAEEVAVLSPPVEEPPISPPEPAQPPAAVTLVVQSIPSGAALRIDDQDYGPTPAVVQDLAPGRHLLRLTRDGYEELTRQIYQPGMLPREPYELRLKPGSVRIASEPAGASVFHGSQLLGQTPVIVDWLPAGEQELVLVSYGYETTRKAVSVSALRGEDIHVQLRSYCGSLELITMPAGFDVYVDDTPKGRTQLAAGADRRQSLPFQVGGLREGEHLVRVEHPNGAVKSERVKVTAGETTALTVRVWVVDTKLTLTDGAVKYGMLLSVNEFGDVELAEPKRQHYMKGQILSREEVTPAEAKSLMRQERSGPTTEEPERAPDAADQGTLPPQPGSSITAAGVAEAGTADDQTVVMTVADIDSVLTSVSSTQVAKAFAGKTVVLVGVPSDSRSNTIEGTVYFGPRIRCTMPKAYYDRFRGRIKDAEDRQQRIALTGTARTHMNVLSLVDAEWVEEIPE